MGWVIYTGPKTIIKGFSIDEFTEISQKSYFSHKCKSGYFGH